MPHFEHIVSGTLMPRALLRLYYNSSAAGLLVGQLTTIRVTRLQAVSFQQDYNIQYHILARFCWLQQLIQAFIVLRKYVGIIKKISP